MRPVENVRAHMTKETGANVHAETRCIDDIATTQIPFRRNRFSAAAQTA
jgi:hypothetical protein